MTRAGHLFFRVFATDLPCCCLAVLSALREIHVEPHGLVPFLAGQRGKHFARRVQDHDPIAHDVMALELNAPDLAINAIRDRILDHLTTAERRRALGFFFETAVKCWEKASRIATHVILRIACSDLSMLVASSSDSIISKEPPALRRTSLVHVVSSSPTSSTTTCVRMR